MLFMEYFDIVVLRVSQACELHVITSQLRRKLVLAYTVIEASEGVKRMSRIWNFQFRPLSDDRFWVDASDRCGVAVADCAEFRLISVSGYVFEIFFFIKDPRMEHLLENAPKPLYLYGGYGQIYVCQMRVKGSISLEVGNNEEGAIREILRDRITARIDKLVHKLSRNDADDRLEIIDEGRLFCFRPEEYAYHTYERG